jgi:DNA-binding MarR family transcriptional regulator
MKNNQTLDYRKCLQVASTCTCMHVRKASRSITQYYDSYLEKSGLTINQFTVLIAMALMNEATMTEAAGVLGMDRTTLSRNINPLIDDGLIFLLEGRDKRTKRLTLSDKGRSALTRAIPLWEEAQEGFVRRMGLGNWKELLNKLSASVVVASNPG